MAIKTALDPWTEIREGRADQAGANIYWLYAAIQDKDFKMIALTLKGIIKHEDWRKWRWIGSDFECNSLRECLFRHPPKGVGLKDIDLLRRLIQDDMDALDKLDEALRNPVGTNQYPDQASLPIDEGLHNVQTHFPSGNSIEAALRRLRADERPLAKELHAKVLAGEMSAHRAAVEAGYRKDPTPLEQIRKLWTKLSSAERDEVKGWSS